MGKIRVPKAILWGGLVCGALDLTAAFIAVGFNFGKGPVWLLQNVAGALLRPASYDGSLATAALGLVMHFTVTFTATTIFYLLSRRWPLLLRWAVPSGLVYGAVVFIVMYRVVIPLTIELKPLCLTTSNHNWPKLRWSQLVVHFVCIGRPIAFTVHRFAPLHESGAKA